VRIYATSRIATLKEPLAMIGLVAAADIVMLLVLVHALHRTVSLTAQWPIGVLILGVIAWGLRSYNLAGRRWIQVTGKQLTWASGPKATKSGFSKSGSVKLADVSGVTVELDEFPVTQGRKESTFRAYRLHAAVEGKPTLILPVIAEVIEDATAAAQEASRVRLLSAIEQIDSHAKKFTVDASALPVIEAAVAETEVETEVETESETEVEETELSASSEATETTEATETEVEETEVSTTEGDEEVEVKAEETETPVLETTAAKADVSD
jgi:hypothetical protein